MRRYDDGMLPKWLVALIVLAALAGVVYQVSAEVSCNRRGGVAIRTPSNMVQCVQSNIIIPVTP